MSTPSSCSRGTDASSGTRVRSDTIIVRRAPKRAITAPDGIPRIAIGTSSAARTMPILVGEPVVESTNHGSARNVICEPERRDDLRRDQRDERTLAERARGRGQTSHVPSC